LSHRHHAFRQTLLDLLAGGSDDDAGLRAALEAGTRRREPVHSTLLEILTHLSFGEAEAREHWRSVVAHRRLLRGRLGRDPGLRVALLDYFANVSRDLRNPKVIEIAIYERTERSAHSDGLTGLYNHAFMRRAVQREVQRARRHGQRVSLVMLDLDDFKRVNDTRGHLGGDRALVAVAGIVRASLREIDTAARYGGEEFALLLPETSRTGAFVVAERVRVALERRFGRGRGASLTLSGGVATYPDDAGTDEELLRRADEALYRAKAAGKNRIVLLRGERRCHARVAVSSTARLEAGGARRARLRNVSAGGLLLELRDPLTVGREVDVAVTAGRGRRLRLRGTVVRVAEAEGLPGFYEIGLRLADPHAGSALLERLHAPALRAPRAPAAVVAP
jgi:diguanylate cyclase (GGDEF)-like protein